MRHILGMLLCVFASLTSFSQNYNITSIPYSPAPWGGQSLTGTFTPGADDGVSGPHPIGFDFCYYGVTYSSAWVGSNGWVSFTGGQPNTYTSASIPSAVATVPKNCVMGPWQDWWSNLNGNGNISYQTVGVAPFRKFVVSFENLPMFSCTQLLGTFQVVINECNNTIEVHILNKPPCPQWAGGTAVLGLHNLNGTAAHVVAGRNSTQWVVTPSAPEGWLFTPVGACEADVFGGFESTPLANGFSSLRQDLEAYYAFSGDATDESGNGRDGSVNGSLLAPDRNGYVRSAYQFDGVDDYIQLPFGLTAPSMSVSAWFRTTDSQGEQAIVDADSANLFGNSILLGYQAANNRLDTRYHDGTYSSTTVCDTARWYHVVAVWEPGQVTTYLDGNLIGSSSFAQGINEGALYTIGRHTAAAPKWFTGRIDEVGFWSRALNVEEITQLYNSGKYTVVETPCFADSIVLKVRVGTVLCSSIDVGGSEFRLYTPSGSLIPIDSVYFTCSNGRTDSLYIKLRQELIYNGDHHLVIRNGRDGDAILAECGTGANPFDTIVVRVQGCYEYNTPIHMRNATVSRDNQFIDLTWNMPSNFDSSYFDMYRVYMNDRPGGTIWREIVRVDTLTDTTVVVREFEPKDETRDFRVVLRMKIYGDVVARGDSANNIWLRGGDATLTDGNRGAALLAWSPYKPWAGPYDVYLATAQDTGVGQLIGSTSDTTFTFDKPIRPGFYIVRVTTRHPSDPFQAWSNYVPFEIKLRDVVIKNVVTPNGDGINDFFHIEEIEYFPDSYLTLYNRWGQIVFERAAYQNDFSPTNLEAGTYIYVLTIPDKPDLTGAMRVVK